MSIAHRVRVENVTLLSDDWYTLKKTSFSFQRSDGTWQQQSRETYDRGNGAVILLYALATRKVVLEKQFRFPAFVNGHDDLLIEAPAGLLDDADPEARIRAEVEEETGYRVRDVRQIFDAFMSPGSVTERLFFFVGEYEDRDRVSEGGGNADEGEDISTFEVGIDEAMTMIATGEIRDGKTIMLLQYAALNIFGANAGNGDAR
ncbi:GDP-mannose pyrophosphatase [Agrobacterium larrymoorei]|uniref:NUDIX domain-containing protein n=1 Tax=Agrobacterium larrymoorei TaxID=160699 RepID=UPI0015729EE5|nr:NUDIX domain-containing protein [Agrobacterium larrymoorei]NTJ44695.1 GDP-mannose pyrophosphatase [Agrobacterium larrymoorei]